MRTLVLDQGYQPHRIVSWQRAVEMIFTDKVEVVEEYDEDIRSVSITIKMPAVVRLLHKVRGRKKAVKFSRINVMTRDSFSCQYCLAPDHKVLTADLRWVSLGELSEGDVLIGFDEELVSPGGRRFKDSTVESHEFAEDELFLVTLDDGTEFRVTKEHEWLSRTVGKSNLTWRRTDGLVGSLVPRLFDVWFAEDSREAGWASGMFDGEGWLAKNKGLQSFFAQNPGQPLGYRRVISVEAIGRGEIVRMRTSSSTFIADGFPHHNCGKRKPMKRLNYDHVIPRAQGGKTCWENIVTACYECNSRKANRTPQEAKMFPRKTPVKPKWLPVVVFRIEGNSIPDQWASWVYWQGELESD